MANKDKKRRSTSMLDQINSPDDLKFISIDDLETLSSELRSDMIDIVSKTGGHLGAGLGVVELAVAIHYVFDTPDDRLIWDVGHQAYPHKILTGRRDKMHSLRKAKGLSGFTKRSESKYDPFGAGHSSTSISAALGMAVARDKLGKSNNVIAVIGDGAMSAGMAYEAMNNAGSINTKLLIILNDNDMSIAPAVGALSNYLSNVVSSRPFNNVREIAKQMVNLFPKEIGETAKRAENLARTFLGSSEGTIFSQMGMNYLGPIDGHDVKSMVKILENLKNDPHDGPVLLHVVTEKGKGHPFSKNSHEKYHAVSEFDLITGDTFKSVSNAPTYTNIFSDTLCKISEKDKKIIAITAAMPSGTGLSKFADKFQDRFFDVGIAEQHAVTFAAGMAAEGLKPYVVIYSTFLQRAYDQVIHDVVIQKLPVKFMMDRAGFVGADGATHAGSFDLAYLCCLPGVVVMAPSNEAELADMIFTSSTYNDGPIFCRYPRGEGEGVDIPETPKVIEIGKGKIVREGKDVAILALGTRVGAALSASDILSTKGYSITVADARFAKPIDTKLLEDLWKKNSVLIIIEEGSVGGFSSHCLHYLSSNDMLNNTNKSIKCLTMPDNFQDHASQSAQLKEAGLDMDGLIKTIEKIYPLSNLNRNSINE
ncbi:1-deoxy-D-xylulose-5-phosphate synthase [Alphaproteobacteria bacterium]|jgi:1-deoxy-D-xylulose-5-phosphate synthase|nr:1-deoxy-D-xylulose-5-phosphate synthase [Alphaproteobacteria bacterium]|tara:strand:+ start:2305 stop:4251 length:1947 start_codon:yes stop_codon:yes gene_type:complete